MDGLALATGRVIFVMAVGPGEGKIAVDSLDSMAAFEPEAEAWILDDCTIDGTYDALVRWAADHPRSRVLRNPEPRGYRGIARSMFSLLSAIAAEPVTPGLVIKIDPDTCVIGPGLVDLIRRRLTADGPGIVGAYRVAANGSAREFRRIRRNMILDLMPGGLHKDRHSIRVGRPFWARYLAAARRNGYEFGEHVLGALSGIHGATLRALSDSGYFDRIPPRYRALTVEEDVLLGLATKAVGHQLLDINVDPARPDVWIQFRPPLPIDAAQLLQQGIRAVHPVKLSPEGETMRAEFKLRRPQTEVAA